MTRPLGYKPSAETIAKISASVRRAHAAGYHKFGFHPPGSLREMYEDFRVRFGQKEARRLVEDHMRIRKIDH